jgi:hypothetical protein
MLFVGQGQGYKNRSILFPQAFGLVLRAHEAAVLAGYRGLPPCECLPGMSSRASKGKGGS